MLWEIDIHPAEGEPDRAGERVASAARELGIADNLQVAAARGYLIHGESLERSGYRTAGRRTVGGSGGGACGRWTSWRVGS